MRIRSMYKRISNLSAFPKLIRRACDTSYLYYHLDVLSPMIAAIVMSSTEANRLQYLLAAFSDGIRLCDASIHLKDEVKAKNLTNYRQYLKSLVTKHIVDPLCQKIETDLRLHVHTKHLDHMEVRKRLH
jgi:WASH complex subunit 7